MKRGPLKVEMKGKSLHRMGRKMSPNLVNSAVQDANKTTMELSESALEKYDAKDLELPGTNHTVGMNVSFNKEKEEEQPPLTPSENYGDEKPVR